MSFTEGSSDNKMLPALFPVVAVIGPTATGKTAVAIRMALEIGAEIVNLDSVQAYKGLDIGSAKPAPSEQRLVRHHLIDLREPCEPLDAASFARIARTVTERLLRQGKNVIMAGGTGFYLKAVMEGLSEMPGRMPGLREMPPDPGQLYTFLQEADPESAKRIHPNDTYRLVRAVEVCLSTGVPFSVWCRNAPVSRSRLISERECRKIGLMLPREELYRRIDARVDEMLSKGLVQEVKGLMEKGYNPGLKPLQSLGYRHIIRYLQGRCSLDEAIHDMKRDTRRYSKRQLTWFRKEPGIQWFRPDELLSKASIWKAVA